MQLLKGAHPVVDHVRWNGQLGSNGSLRRVRRILRRTHLFDVQSC